VGVELTKCQNELDVIQTSVRELQEEIKTREAAMGRLQDEVETVYISLVLDI
jgi:Arc/MetJ-type ribon-helix-helix transcriptional regulator